MNAPFQVSMSLAIKIVSLEAYRIGCLAEIIELDDQPFLLLVSDPVRFRSCTANSSTFVEPRLPKDLLETSDEAPISSLDPILLSS